MFLHPLTFHLQVSLGLKWVSCRQHIDGFCFFIHSDTLCLLIEALSPLTFRVSIERYEFSAIVLPLRWLLLYIVSIPFSSTSFRLSLCFEDPFNISCRASLVFANSFSFCVSWKLFISPIFNNSLAGYSILGYMFFSLSALNIHTMPVLSGLPGPCG